LSRILQILSVRFRFRVYVADFCGETHKKCLLLFKSNPGTYFAVHLVLYLFLQTVFAKNV